MIREKILSPGALARELKKRKGAKVVFTNGCFDIVHAGHVTYLERARNLGDILVVALNTDASTKRLKGPGRPINRLSDRAKVIGALESVSFVTSFREDTPLSLIKKLKPDVLVKGGDYEVKTIVGYEQVIASGGVVKTIPFLEGRSTTRILAKAKRGP
ncbi:MAG: D-glycero-beta-D-manno-heptose 1-phosphate adenylyltransferase [Bdellovibrionales bacterium]|nr:D-glycero-beta-D-manno-heptose 1-phosphate adenylyltransferase [Bdellovibrionales bacterium]